MHRGELFGAWRKQNRALTPWQVSGEGLRGITVVKTGTTRSRMSVCDTCLVQIVRRHFEADLVADADADEVLAHFAGDVRKHLSVARHGDPEHCPGQYLGYGPNQFNRFFFRHVYKGFNSAA